MSRSVLPSGCVRVALAELSCHFGTFILMDLAFEVSVPFRLLLRLGLCSVAEFK